MALSLVIFQYTVTLFAVPLRFTGKLRNIGAGPAGSWTETASCAVENAISPLASLAVMLRKTADLLPILGDLGGTWLVNGDAVGKNVSKTLN